MQHHVSVCFASVFCVWVVSFGVFDGKENTEGLLSCSTVIGIVPFMRNRPREKNALYVHKLFRPWLMICGSKCFQGVYPYRTLVL